MVGHNLPRMSRLTGVVLAPVPVHGLDGVRVSLGRVLRPRVVRAAGAGPAPAVTSSTSRTFTAVASVVSMTMTSVPTVTS